MLQFYQNKNFRINFYTFKVDTAPVEEVNRDDKSVHIALSQAKQNSVIINFKPLRLDFYVGKQL